MNRKVLYPIIILICISLSGIIAVQFFWIRNAIEVKEAQFDQNVYEALGLAAGKLETQDNLRYISKYQVSDSIRQVFQSLIDEQSLLSDLRSDPEPAPRSKGTRKQESPSKRKVVSYNMTYNMLYPGGTLVIDTMWNNIEPAFGMTFPDDADFFFTWNEKEFQRMDSLMRLQEMAIKREFREFTQPMQFGNDYDMVIKYSLPVDQYRTKEPPLSPDRENKALKEQVRKLNAKAKKFRDVVKKMTLETETKPRPVEERIDKNDLSEILKKYLSDKDIKMDFEFGVIQPQEASPLTPVRSEGFRSKDLNTKYRVSLFPNDLFQKQYSLLISFNGSGQNILAYLSWLMIASVIFTLIIMVASGLSIYVMIRQKKISDIKTDFINNMTHEFKTPIATISIAADSINNPKVIENPEVIRNYTRVIKEENRRMNSRVEQVLQMALLDSRGFRLNERQFDVHDVIRKVTDNIRLQTESKDGKLSVNLGAERSWMVGDESHINNVLISILDNAIKYSAGQPEINVFTKNVEKYIIIAIDDHGIGMSSDAQKKIFDKFYRVTSGNIHNVKGFGLGLSYAKAIVLAHKGEIRVTSEPGKGSLFEVVLPVIAPFQEVLES